MEFIFGWLQQLYASLSIGQFLMVIAIIIAVSGCIVVCIVKLAQRCPSILSLLQPSRKNEQDISEIKQLIGALSAKLDLVILEVKEIISTAAREQHARDINILSEISRTVAIKEEITELYARLNHSLEEVKQNIKLQDTHEQQTAENIRSLLQHGLDAIKTTHSQIEKIDSYIRDQVPQFRSDNKEFAKELTELSKDLALIERTIQTQISNTDRAVTLRR